MKNRRHFMIMDLIEKMRIETQEELCEQLRKQGFNVTQATVSRDIKEMGLIKISDEQGYFYSLPGSQEAKATPGHVRQVFRAMVMHIDYSENIVVIKTTPGAAQSAALLVDHAHFPEVIGCVAGDDTILVVVKPKEATETIAKKLRVILYDESAEE